MKYNEEFKRQLVALVQAGRKPTEITKEYGIGDSTIYTWMRQYGDSTESSDISDIERENIMLKEQLRRVEIERDILKQAALIMGQSNKP